MKKLIFIFMFIFLVGSVSAFEFDNVQEYDKDKREYTITNALGLGEDIAKVKLTSDLKQLVPRGYEKVAEFEVENFEDYVNVFNNMEFQDLKNNAEVFERDFDYRYKTIVQVPNYINVCDKGLTPNGTAINVNCRVEQDGLKDQTGWVKIKKEDGLLKGNLTIGIFTDVQKGDSIEWIPTLFGERLTEWATWTESLNTNLLAYWTANQTSGNLTDSTGNQDCENISSVTYGHVGIQNFSVGTSDVGNVFACSPAGNDYFNFYAFDFSIEVWFNKTTAAGADDFFFSLQAHTNSAGAMNFGIKDDDTLKQLIALPGVWDVTNEIPITFALNEWHQAIIVRNGTNFSTYYDGAIIDSFTNAGSLKSDQASRRTRLGGYGGAGEGWNGLIDEVGVWNRSLTGSEIIDLYNGGAGITFTDVFDPTVILNSPINAFNTTSQTIDFNGTVTKAVSGINNVSLFIDGILNETNSSGINDTDYLFTKNVLDGSHNWTYEACDTSNVCTTATTRNFTIDSAPAIIVTDPTVNNSNFTTSTIFFNATNSLAVDKWIVNYNGTNVTLSDINTSLEVEDGDHHLLLYANNSATGKFGLNDSIFFSVDVNNPAINVTEPFGVVIFQDQSINQTIKWNVSDVHIDTCTLEYEGSNQTVNCGTNISNFTIGTERTLTLYANDTFGNLNSSTVTWSYLALQTGFTFNSSSFETSQETFIVNITTNGSEVTAGSLTFDGTENTGATITNPTGNNYTITKAIDIPIGVGVSNFSFNLTIGGHLVNTTIQNQIINVTTFEDCNLAFSYINITFKNETISEEIVSAQIDSDWNFWLGSGSVFKTFSFTNTTENFDYPFCLTSGGNRTLSTNVSLTYDNSISEQRSFSNTYSLTNDTTNVTLFLLPTTDGVFVTFQTVTVAEQVISGVTSNVTKSSNLISSGVTDDAGLIQYFLDPDTSYVFSFSKTGFAVVTTTLKPTQSSFTIIMGTLAPSVQNDTTKGINYTINPISNVLNNNTETEFNLTFSSSFWLLDSFGFALKNSTGDVFNLTSSTTNTGGFLSQFLNTGNNTDLIMEVFWTINGSQTNVTTVWLVRDTSDEGFSIKTFFDDLSIYLNSGLFGLTSFGLGLIVFLIILITTGVLSTKFGITSPAGISIIVLAMVLFFDVALGIMPNPINAVPNFPSIFVGVVFLGLFIKEAIIR